MQVQIVLFSVKFRRTHTNFFISAKQECGATGLRRMPTLVRRSEQHCLQWDVGRCATKPWRSSSLNKSRRHHHYPRAHVVDFVQPIRSSAASDAAPIACTLHVFLRAEFLIKGSRLGLIQSAIAAVHDEIVAFKKTRLKEL